MLKMAIIGFGGMGSWHYSEVSARLSDYISVKGVYDVSKERLSIAKAYGLHIYENADDIIADSEIELVLVATPNIFHCMYSEKMLLGAKNVVCEKPVTLNLEELEIIFAAQKKSGKLFTVHQNRRFDIDYQIAKNVLKNNLIGAPYFINSRLYGSKGIPEDWRTDKLQGGGMLYDWSVHLIDQILNLLESDVKSVYAQLENVKYTDVDDCNKILIEFKNGAKAEIVTDTANFIKENRWHIGGDEGTFVLYDWFGIEGKIIKCNNVKSNFNDVIVTPNGRTRTLAPQREEELTEIALPLPRLEETARWEDYYINVYNCIKNNATPLVTQKQIYNTMKVLEACIQSNNEKRVIHFS